MRQGTTLPDPALTEVSNLLAERAATSSAVRWALLDTMELYTLAVLWRLDGVPAAELGRRLARAIDRWAIQMPFTPIWPSLAKSEILQELEFLKSSLLRTEEARRQFGYRLTTRFPYDRRLEGLLIEAGYFTTADAMTSGRLC
jgi:hypothetical protein